MNKPDPLIIDKLVEAVTANSIYKSMDHQLIRRIIEETIPRYKKPGDVIKSVRKKLHQVGSAYLNRNYNYAQWSERLISLPKEITHPDIRQYCLDVMPFHASTSERLPILEQFYRNSLAPIGKIHSILDLACGLNPLAIPWMNLEDNARYEACDIFTDLIAFVADFFSHFSLNARAYVHDLLEVDRLPHFHLVLLLKTIPCLEQVDKEIGRKILTAINADHVLVSFPVKSLGGAEKGMKKNYAEHFHQMVDHNRWAVTRFEFSTELAFLLSSRS